MKRFTRQRYDILNEEINSVLAHRFFLFLVVDHIFSFVNINSVMFMRIYHIRNTSLSAIIWIILCMVVISSNILNNPCLVEWFQVKFFSFATVWKQNNKNNLHACAELEHMHLIFIDQIYSEDYVRWMF